MSKEFTILVGPNKLQVTPLLNSKEYSILSEELKYKVHGYRFTDAYRYGGWDGHKKLFYKNHTAPSGCYKKISNVLSSFGHTVDIQFINDYPSIGNGEIYEIDELEKFQKDGSKLAVQHKFCILKAPVRAGKTVMIAKIIQTIGQTPVIVLTKSEKDIVVQIQESLKKSTRRNIGILSEGVFEKEDIIVSSYGAIRVALNPSDRVKNEAIIDRNKRVLDIVKKTKVLILDECHHIMSTRNRKILDHFDSLGYKIGTSGTPKPDKFSLLEVEATIGPVVMSVPFKTLIKTGRIVQPAVILYDLPHQWYSNVFEEYNDVYEGNVVNNNLRNRFIYDIVCRLKGVNKTCFIAVNKLEHGNILRSLIPNSFFINGSIKTNLRRDLYESIQSKKLNCIISTVGKEALDIPKLDAVINAEGFESSVATIQRMRSLTSSEGKKLGIVIDFLDKGKYLEKSSRRRKRQYNKLKGFIIKNRKVGSNYYKLEESRWIGKS